MQDSYLQFHGRLAGSAVFHVGMIEKRWWCVLYCVIQDAAVCLDNICKFLEISTVYQQSVTFVNQYS